MEYLWRTTKHIMKKIIFALFILTLLFSSVAKAEDAFKIEELQKVELPPKPERDPKELGEKQMWVPKGYVVLWEGLLLNPEAAAAIISEYENISFRANQALETQRELDLKKLNLEVGKLKLDLIAQDKKNVIVLEGRDKELKSCQTLNKQILEDRGHLKNKILIGLGSGVAGAVLGLLIGIFAH